MTFKVLLKFTIETGARFTKVTVRGRKQHSIALLPPGSNSLTKPDIRQYPCADGCLSSQQAATVGVSPAARCNKFLAMKEALLPSSTSAGNALLPSPSSYMFSVAQSQVFCWLASQEADLKMAQVALLTVRHHMTKQNCNMQKDHLG